MKKLVGFCFIILLISCNQEELDTISPTIIEIYPENLSQQIPLDVQIWIQFSEQIDTSSLIGNFVVMLEDSTIMGKIQYDQNDFVVIFLPFQKLINAKTYDVVLNDGITDISGNLLKKTEWEFTTIESDSATYDLIFNATWSSQTHPVDFPSNSHFSGIIGMSHNDSSTLFVEGKLASLGIKNMAELGSKLALIDEINLKIGEGDGFYLISGEGINPSPGKVSAQLLVDQSHSFVSVTSMIAPSPDWFIAASVQNLLQGGFWIDSLTVDVTSYDAGTDSGVTFKSANLTTNPPENIFKIDSPPLGLDGNVISLGTFTFIRRE